MQSTLGSYYNRIVTSILNKIPIVNKYTPHLLGMSKFAFVGASGALVGFTMIYCLTEFLHVHYLISAGIAAVSTNTMCYTLNHYWTFDKAKVRHGWLAGWVKYQVGDAVFDALFVGEMALFTEVCGIWYMASAVLAVLINYPIKYHLFRRYIWDVSKKDA